MGQAEVDVIREDLRLAMVEFRSLGSDVSKLKSDVAALQAAERFQVDQRHGVLILLAAGIGSVVTWFLGHLSLAK